MQLNLARNEAGIVHMEPDRLRNGTSQGDRLVVFRSLEGILDHGPDDALEKDAVADK